MLNRLKGKKPPEPPRNRNQPPVNQKQKLGEQQQPQQQQQQQQKEGAVIADQTNGQASASVPEPTENKYQNKLGEINKKSTDFQKDIYESLPNKKGGIFGRSKIENSSKAAEVVQEKNEPKNHAETTVKNEKGEDSLQRNPIQKASHDIIIVNRILNSTKVIDLVKTDEINLNNLFKSEKYQNAKQLDFSGVESVTDLTIYLLSKNLKEHKNKNEMSFDEVKLNCCKYITVWSLHYLYAVIDKNLLDLARSPYNLSERVSGCDEISDTMIVSFKYDNNSRAKYDKKLINCCKAVVINQDKLKPMICDYIAKSGAASASNANSNLFSYSRVKLPDNKFLNIYECCESMCDYFLSERNSIVITFNPNNPNEEEEKNSILNRLLKVMVKNIIPASIMILGVGSTDKQTIEKYSKLITDSLKDLQNTLQTNVDNQTTDLSNLTFQTNKMLSPQINLSQQIILVLKMLDFSSINLGDKKETLYNQKLQIKLEDISKKAEELSNALQECYYGINKSDLIELKAIKSPPQAMVLVTDAICILFSKTPNFNNFKALVNTTDFLSSLKNYNIDSVSDYAVQQLQKYVSDPNFTQDYVSKVSRASGFLCKWVLAVYEYATFKSSNESNSQFSSLTDYLNRNSFYTFTLKFYCKKSEAEKIDPIESLAEKIDFKKKCFMSFQDYVSMFETDKGIHEKLAALNNYTGVAEKYLASQSAKGNFLFTRESNYLITDPSWLKNILNMLKNTPIKSNEYKFLSEIIGADTPVWSVENFKKSFSKLLPDPQLLNSLIDYLSKMNMLMKIKANTKKQPESDLFIPICFLREDIPSDTLKTEWIDNWEGHEYKMSFRIYSPIPFAKFSELINRFFDVKKTIYLWKRGILNRDGCCLVLITYSDSNVTISSRIINPEKQFDIPGDSYLTYSKFIYMEYYQEVEYMLFKNHIPLQFENVESGLHPISEDLMKTNDDSNVKTTASLIYASNKAYYNEYQRYSHELILKDSKFSCKNCYQVNKNLLKFFDMVSFVYPMFENMSISRFGSDLYDKNLVIINSDSKYSVVDPLGFYYLEIKFIDRSYENFDVIISLTQNANDSEYFSINLTKLTYNDKSSQLNGGLKIRKSKLQASNSSNRIVFSTGDIVKVIAKDKDSDLNTLSVYCNDNLLIDLEISIKIVVRPHVEFKKVVSESDPSNSIMIASRKNLLILKGLFSLADLVGCRLEARDIKNPHLCCVASITQADPTDGRVLIHFDGWGENFDYWASIDDSKNLFPCGFMEYIYKTTGTYSYSGMKSLEKPRGYPYSEFVWEDYFHQKNFSPVPFHIFTEKQTQGMKLSDFKTSKNKTAFASCDQNNPRTKPDKMVEYIKTNYYSIFENKLSMVNDAKTEAVRGLLIMPKNAELIFTRKPLSILNGDINIHMSCFNIARFVNSTVKRLNCHLINDSGISISPKMINKNDLIMILLSSYALTVAENSYIVSNFEKLFPSCSLSLIELNEKVRKYFMDIFRGLCIFFEISDFDNAITVDLKKYFNLIPDEQHQNPELIFYKNTENPLGMCWYCNAAENRLSDFDSKIDNKYGYSCCKLTLYSNNIDLAFKNGHIIQEKFFDAFKDLKFISLTNIPIEINEFKHLFLQLPGIIELEISNNSVKSLPQSIYNLTNLVSLKIKNNPIKIQLDDPKEAAKYTKPVILNFEQFKNLKVLELGNLSELKEIVQVHSQTEREFINLPSSLALFTASKFESSFIPFNTKNIVDNLTELKFTGVPWIDIEQYGGKNAIITNENVLTTYDKIFPREFLTKMFSLCDTSKDGFLDHEETVKLNAIIFKKVARLSEETDPSNPTNKLPIPIFHLVNLTYLDLSYQSIKFIPREIEKLTNLKVLILNNCVMLENISSKLGNLPLEELSINNCYSLKTPPPEICKRGFKSIMSYLKRLSTGSVPCKKTKLMLVGLGEAGKTSLMNALKDQYYGYQSQVTDGIDIIDWVIPLEDNTQLTYSMWDFAGQSVYYNTHQFFLSSRAVYILVWNVRLGSEYAGLEFWLNSISCHAPGAPIFVVGTHIDQVSKYSLNEEDLKSRYKQIAGFFFVSSKSGDGVSELKTKLVEVTLQEKYIGERIPEVWLKFENNVKKERQRNIITLDQISEIAEMSSIYDKTETLQAIKFLNDLGALQYFENDSLKDKIVINPQWIVNVMACVVSVKHTAIEDGKLFHDQVSNIWNKYEEDLHMWMLKLTEEFDLTFPVPEMKMNIVPCLLPDIEPVYEWLDITTQNSKTTKEFKVVYTFVYLPAGLFNRIQVRLYQYADSSSIWKSGSLLRKNNHSALIKQNKNSSIEIKVQGIKPENIVFVIHEVIETLINESFNGIKYDYSFPCPECVDTLSLDPCLFSSSFLRRANEFKAPFLQCNKFFHAISIQEMLSVMPVEGISNLDLNLEYSLRDLKQLKTNLKYDIMFWFCQKDVDNFNHDQSNSINPKRVLEELQHADYKVWYSKNAKEEKMDKVTYAIKQSKLVLLGISDEFSHDEKSMQVFELVKNIIKKSYLLIEFGHLGLRKWLEDPKFAAICSDYRVIMQDPNRYKAKTIELFEAIERQIKDTKIEKSLKLKPPDVFISYCWANSHEAVKKGTRGTKTSLGWLDPRTLVDFFKEHNITAWLDIQEVNSTNTLFGEITKGMNNVSVVVACLSDEYVKSQNCTLEFRFAHVSLKLPIIKAVVGTSNEWRHHELSFLGGIYPEVNFQYENNESYSTLLKFVQAELDKVRESREKKQAKDKHEKRKQADDTNAAFQELYELTQRKFLNYLVKLSTDKGSSSKTYPRLICIDLVEKSKYEDYIKEIQNDLTNMVDTIPDKEAVDEKKTESDPEERRKADEKPDEEKKPQEDEKRESVDKEKINERPQTAKDEVDSEAVTGRKTETPTEAPIQVEYLKCLRPMCEFEEGWHLCDSFVLLPELNSLYCIYLARIMNIIRNGNLSNELQIFSANQGIKLIEDIESKASASNTEDDTNDINESYASLRKFFITECENKNLKSLHTILNFSKDNTNNKNRAEQSSVSIGLERCELKNGKVLWLCKKHLEQSNARVLTDSKTQNTNALAGFDQNKNKMLDLIEEIKIELL